MTEREFSRGRTHARPRANLDALSLEVWDVTKMWMLVEKCFADARKVEELLREPDGRRQLAFAPETVLRTLDMYRAER